MLYNEFITSQEYRDIYTRELTNSYPVTMKYLENKYGNYELKYPPMVFFKLTYSLFIEFQSVLKDIENAINIRKSHTFDLDNLGKVKKSRQSDNVTQENKDKESYSGYNVDESDYRVDSGNYSSNRDSNFSNTDVNILYALRALEGHGKKLAWFTFEERFVKNFITLYSIDI